MIEWFWGLMGWEITGGSAFEEAFGTLLAPFLTPIGAVVACRRVGRGAGRARCCNRGWVSSSQPALTSLHAQ